MKNPDKRTTILKSAILLERQGIAFYSMIAKQTTNSSVREIFETMAKEETLHAEYLSQQFRNAQEQSSFLKLDLREAPKFTLRKVLTSDIKNSLSAASYEAAAISAAMALEERAVQTYREGAKEASDQNEKALYDWLANWEQDHLEFLSELNKELTEKIWYDNKFWPF